MNIESFIEQARSLGAQDSEGVFTIAREQAIRKLAQLQLPGAQSWVLKLLQAAVSSGAQSFTAEAERHISYFSYDPTELFEIDELVKALTEPEADMGRSLRHLATGLRAVGFGDNRSFTFAFEQGHQCFLLGWDGTRLAKRIVSVSRPSSGPLIRLGIAHPGPPSRKCPPEVTLEMEELRLCAEVATIAVVVNRKRADDFNAPLVDGGHGLGKRVTLSAGWAPSRRECSLQQLALPGALLRSSRPIGLGDRFTDDRIFHVEGRADQTESPCLAKISYGYHIDSHRSSLGKFRFHNKPRYSYVHWVKDGVVVDRHRWKFEPTAVAFDLYLSAEGLPSDLSGLRIVRRPDVPHRIAKGLPWVVEQAGATRARLLSHFPRPFLYHSTIAGFFTLVALGSPPAALFKLLAGGVAATHMGLSIYDKRQLMKDAVWHLERLMETCQPRRSPQKE